MSRDMNEVSNKPAVSLEEAHSRPRENCSAKALWQQVVRAFHGKVGLCLLCSHSTSSSPLHIPFRNLLSFCKAVRVTPTSSLPERGQSGTSPRQGAPLLRAAGMHPLHAFPYSLMEPECGGGFDLMDGDKTVEMEPE